MPTVANPSLSSDERQLLEQFVAELRELLGADLHAVWLFGSRARGEPPAEDSDIDLLVLAADASWDAKERIHAALGRATTTLESRRIAWNLSIHVHTLAWLRGRREIQSFFIGEVDRDKIVLHGEP